MKILKPFTSTGGIFFPIGRPPRGTCEFSTKMCRKYCYAENYSHFDFETNISQEEKWKVYNFIINERISTVVEKFKQDLDGLQTPILHWFGTGDCMTKDLDRISILIESIPGYIVQMGFTRNIKLWERHKDIMALSIEDLSFAEGKDGLFSKPDYIEGTSQMYSSKYQVRGGFCGPFACKDLVDSSLAHFVNCQVCRKLKVGCFDRR